MFFFSLNEYSLPWDRSKYSSPSVREWPFLRGKRNYNDFQLMFVGWRLFTCMGLCEGNNLLGTCLCFVSVRAVLKLTSIISHLLKSLFRAFFSWLWCFIKPAQELARVSRRNPRRMRWPVTLTMSSFSQLSFASLGVSRYFFLFVTLNVVPRDWVPRP